MPQMVIFPEFRFTIRTYVDNILNVANEIIYAYPRGEYQVRTATTNAKFLPVYKIYMYRIYSIYLNP